MESTSEDGDKAEGRAGAPVSLRFLTDAELGVSQAPLIHVETPSRGRIHICRANHPPRNARAIRNSVMRETPEAAETDAGMNCSQGTRDLTGGEHPRAGCDSTDATTVPISTPCKYIGIFRYLIE